MKNVLTLVLAGGKGSRLEPLTTHRAKPAVPFGGAYRIIDFALSNCINSGLRKVFVLTQYKSASLARHLTGGWKFLTRELDEFVEVLHPQQRIHDDWYRGTAEAVYQNIYTLEQHPSDHIVILSGDHIYQMDYSKLVQHHIDQNADATIACLPVTLSEGRDFGIMSVDSDGKVIAFDEKPEHPTPLENDPTRTLASMGVYVFRTDFLMEELIQEANREGSSFDFGKDMIPRLINTSTVQSYRFEDPATGDCRYWRDVGTLDAYYEATMELLGPNPGIELHRSDWPTRTHSEPLPPPVFRHLSSAGDQKSSQVIQDSMICPGAIVEGSVIRSVLGPGVTVGEGSTITDSILFKDVKVGRNAQVSRTIADKGVNIPDGLVIGSDASADELNGCTVDPSGLRIIPEP